VEEYSTNDLMEADWECVERRLRVGDVGLLVGASVFGSSALLERLHDSDTAALLRGHGVHVLVDLAQDIRLTRYLPAAAHDIVWAILSFNNKSFPGVMGGGILGRAPVGVVRKELAPGQRRFLYHVLSMTILLRLVRYKKPTLGTGYDFSHCTDFPYQIEGHVYEPIKLQYAMALIGMRSLRRFDKLKARVLRLDAHLPTRFASTAAYLVLKEPREELRDQEIKAPYALDAEPRRSLRPDQLVIHNKGFADRVR
jgi:hypothetical protein